MKKSLLLLSALVFLGCWSSEAMAQTTTATSNTEAEEEALDNAITNFGYTSGLAFQCSSESTFPDLEQEVLRAYTGITRLFGSDRAFFYAAAYGNGATASIDRNQCSQYIRDFQEAMQRGREDAAR